MAAETAAIEIQITSEGRSMSKVTYVSNVFRNRMSNVNVFECQ